MFILPIEEPAKPDPSSELLKAEETIARLQQELRAAQDALQAAGYAAVAAKRGLVMAVNWPAPVKSPNRTPFVPAEQYESREQFTRGWNSCLSACQNAVYARERVIWPNGSEKTVIEALRFLSRHQRPVSGQARFNAEHLLQLAVELEAVVKQTTL